MAFQQETIAVSEYVRALKLKTDNRKDEACSLFCELLETEVLHNVDNKKKDKLLSVKYNCYKNLGFIYNEMGDSETALSYLLNVNSWFRTVSWSSVRFIVCFDCSGLRIGRH